MVTDINAYRRQKRQEEGRKRRQELSRIVAHGDEKEAIRALIALEELAQEHERMDELHARMERATGLNWRSELW